MSEQTKDTSDRIVNWMFSLFERFPSLYKYLAIAAMRSELNSYIKSAKSLEKEFQELGLSSRVYWCIVKEGYNPNPARSLYQLEKTKTALKAGVLSVAELNELYIVD